MPKLAVGAGLQWPVWVVEEGFFRLTGGGNVAVNFVTTMLAVSCAFFNVKVGGFGDFGHQSLTPFEREINNLD